MGRNCYIEEPRQIDAQYKSKSTLLNNKQHTCGQKSLVHSPYYFHWTNGRVVDSDSGLYEVRVDGY